MYKEEINRILELFSHLDEVDIENDIEQITNAGFKDINDYNFINYIYTCCNTFIKYVPKQENLEEKIPLIQKDIILIKLLKRDNIDI
ncbi:hypothetical protein IJI31_00130 [bacterium]|nr:hypothetical protein [bacterium]